MSDHYLMRNYAYPMMAIELLISEKVNLAENGFF